ncbi:copper amine oxidase N-terminal domain-containing protein [Paenibacillus alkalitolerans]|uniref:copper amine oxidase N-terminal domain-containing protein n=1 Tax=Paenibacillus alkalitolerans TaxID=2799335 RepID=UPI0018F6134E|nr:copper amine oxidase N-terminal domain-containing protein [Paenibacillus alkalitolerans]
MTTKYKTFFRLFLAFAILYSFAFMALAYVVDPLQFYRKAWYPPLFSEEERYQNPGLAKNYEYDTIIVGSSMTQNFVPSYVERKLGGNVLKLSIEGSTSREQRLIAETALRTGKVKRVIWGLDYFALRGDSEAVRSDQGPFPFHLYDDNLVNDILYLFNFSVVRQAAEVVYDRMAGEESETLETLNNWDEAADYGAERTYENYLTARGLESGMAESEVPLETVRKSFERNVLALIESYPDVQWVLYYPPYSILRHYVWYELNPERFDNQLSMKEWMFEKLSVFPNVSIHDFQSDESITFNLDNYKDISHHSQAINEYIIDGLAAGAHIVTKDNVHEYTERLRRQVAELDPYRLDPNRVIVVVRGQELAMDPKPVMTEDAVIMAPARGTLDKAGVGLNWDAASGQMTLKNGNVTVLLTAGRDTAGVNGERVMLDAAPRIAAGRLLIPLAAVAEILGFETEWDEGERTFTIR